MRSITHVILRMRNTGTIDSSSGITKCLHYENCARQVEKCHKNNNYSRTVDCHLNSQLFIQV